MRRYIPTLLLAFLLSGISPLFSQVNLSLHDKGLSQYQAFFVADFDFLEVGSQKDFFDIVVSNTGPAIQDAVFSLNFYKGSDIIAFLRTDPFVLPTIMSEERISNIDLANGNFKFSGQNETVTISESGIKDLANDLKDEIISNSQLPIGEYALKISLSAPALNEKNADIKIIITNPTQISLITPGTLFGSGFVYEQPSEFPVFQWNGNSNTYQVVVFKKETNMTSTEDVLNSFPVWESDRIEGALTAQYPQDSKAIPLERNQTYVWMVRSFIETSAGENFVNSELWEFKVVDPSQINSDIHTMAKDELFQLLRQLLGSKAEAIILEIESYNLSTLRINGSTVSIQQLYKYLDKYRDQPHEVEKLTIRSSN